MKRILIILTLLIGVAQAQSKPGFFVVGGKIITVQDTASRKYLKAIENEGVVPTVLMNMASNFLVTSEKAIGSYSLISAQYPMMGGTGNTHRYNLNNPVNTDSGFRLVFSGTFTHSATGALPTSATSTANTFLNPNTSLSLNSVHISFYSGTNVQNNFYDISAGSGFRVYGNGSGFNGGNASSSTFHQIATTNSLGWYGINRINSTQSTVFKNGVLNTISNTSSALANATTTIFGESTNSSQREGRLIILGGGFTDAQLVSQSQIVTFFNSLLSR